MSNDDNFNQFLGAMALGADGASRKPASPSVLSPLPAGPPPSGETIFKKKNRHIKTSSQPVRIDTVELRKEYAKANEIAAIQHLRQTSEDDKYQRDVAEIDKNLKSLGGSGEEAEESKKSKSVGLSISKALQKISLVRGVSAASEKSSGSPRPRSPSKEKSIKLGNRSAIVSKLGFGGHFSKRDSGEEKDEAYQQGNTSSDDLQQSSPSPKLTATHLANITTTSLTMPPTVSSAGATQRRSSATPTLNNNLLETAGQQQSQTSQTGESVEEQRRRERRSSGLKAASEKARPAPIDVPIDRTYATTDLSPVFLQEKNPSASTLQAFLAQDINQTANSVLVNKQRIETETAKLKDDHAILELGMAKTVKGALLIAKTAPSRKKRSSLESSSSKDDAMRIAALTLQASNDARLRELTEKFEKYEQKTSAITHHANRIRDDLVSECQKLVEMANKIEATAAAERETFKQRELSYRTANTKAEHELKMLNEKVSEVLFVKEKTFRDMLNEAEARLRNFALGSGATGEQGWIMGTLDHGMHSLMELALLGGGTILSTISSFFVAIKGLIPGVRVTRRPPPPPKNRRHSSSNSH
jgi:hypothetical protein